MPFFFRFRIDPKTGEISIRPCKGVPGSPDCLDYENNEDHAYHFTVIARDSFAEGYSATAAVTVNVQNDNDNPPVMKQSEYISYIVEGTIYPNPPITVQVSNM